MFETRDALLGYRAGATVGVTAPTGSRFIQGLAVAFDAGAPHKLAKGAIVQNVTALHVSVQSSDGYPSISTQIAALRNLLNGGGSGEVATHFSKVSKVRR